MPDDWRLANAKRFLRLVVDAEDMAILFRGVGVGEFEKEDLVRMVAWQLKQQRAVEGREHARHEQVLAGMQSSLKAYRAETARMAGVVEAKLDKRA
jgi:hypothetical protein